MNLNRQDEHAKVRWTKRCATYKSLVTMKRYLNSRELQNEMLITAIMDANETSELTRLNIQSRIISSTSFSTTFDQLSDLGCLQLFRFRHQEILGPAPIFS